VKQIATSFPFRLPIPPPDLVGARSPAVVPLHSLNGSHTPPTLRTSFWIDEKPKRYRTRTLLFCFNTTASVDGLAGSAGGGGGQNFQTRLLDAHGHSPPDVGAPCHHRVSRGGWCRVATRLHPHPSCRKTHILRMYVQIHLAFRIYGTSQQPPYGHQRLHDYGPAHRNTNTAVG